MTKLRNKSSALFADELLRHSAILFAGMIVVHACNLVYQMAVSRALPETEYALLAAFLGVLAIIQSPLSTLTAGISRYSSLLYQDGRTGDVTRLLKKWLLLAGIPSLLLGGAAIVFNGPMAGFFHLDLAAPVVITGALLPALFCLPVLNGAGQGLQMFGWCSASAVLGALVRLVLGAGFVWFLYSACGWAMLGHGAGIYASAAVLLAGLFLVLRGQRKSSIDLPSMRFYLLQSFFIQTAYAVLMTADVVLVKHYLPADTEFAYAATLGRMVVFFPGPIVAAMFPKVASHGTATAHQRSIFIRSFGYTALFVAAAAAGCFCFPGLLARILGITGASVYLKRMIGLMGLVMGISALLNVVVQFLVAQRRFRPAFIVVWCVAVYLAGVVVAHQNSWVIAGISGVCNLLALLLLLLFSLGGKADG